MALFGSIVTSFFRVGLGRSVSNSGENKASNCGTQNPRASVDDVLMLFLFTVLPLSVEKRPEPLTSEQLQQHILPGPKKSSRSSRWSVTSSVGHAVIGMRSELRGVGGKVGASALDLSPSRDGQVMDHICILWPSNDNMCVLD